MVVFACLDAVSQVVYLALLDPVYVELVVLAYPEDVLLHAYLLGPFPLKVEAMFVKLKVAVVADPLLFVVIAVVVVQVVQVAVV